MPAPNRGRLVTETDGVSDVVYEEGGRVRFWINQSGRALVDGGEVLYTPRGDAANARVTDLLGTGTAGLVRFNAYFPVLLGAFQFPGEDLGALQVRVGLLQVAVLLGFISHAAPDWQFTIGLTFGFSLPGAARE